MQRRKNVNSVLDWLMPSLVSAVIPLIVMFITLRREKKSVDKQSKENKEQFEKQLLENKEQFEKTLSEQKEVVRIDIMPFLSFDKSDIKTNIKTDMGDRILTIAIEMKNAGNNSALNPEVLSFDAITADGTDRRMVVFQNQVYKFCYFIRSHLNIAILGKNEKRAFEIGLDLDEVGIDEKKPLDIPSDNITFKIGYSDLKGNQYIQSFKIWISFKDKKFDVVRRSVCLPELTEIDR